MRIAVVRVRIGSSLGALALGAVTASCLEPSRYPCASDVECVVDGVQGACQSSGFCAYPDGRCPSQLRYGPAADNAFECVPVGVATDGDSHAFVADDGGGSSSGSSTGVLSTTGAIEGSGSGGCGVCDDPPGPCWMGAGSCSEDGCVYPPQPAGTACTIDDACVTASECDGAGACVVTGGMQCNQPPGPCFSPRGQCQKDGTCSYEQLPAGSDCDDGDGCTTGESCDAAGVCGGGDPCSSDNPCETASCVGGNCVVEPLDDGDSCGATSSLRCCDGNCVDISTDADNCGGCGVSCDADDSCESVEVTSSCSDHPADTTGRCTCDGANADCPLSQVCRTQSPYTNRCTPNSADNCVNEFQDIGACPNYCYYP